MIYEKSSLLISELRFAKGGTIDEHPGDSDAEVYCLEGAGFVSVGELVSSFEAGQRVLWPKGINHNLWTTETEMQVLIVHRSSDIDGQRRIDEIARFTLQPREVAEFYAAVLDTDVPAGDRDVFSFDVDGVNLFIHPTDDEPLEPGWPEGVDHIAFGVEDLDKECERLRRQGYVVGSPQTFPWGRSAYLSDPDGRMVELHETLTLSKAKDR
ncbi:MAG: VOC family protein [Actinobacteria bacterium]|nr:VOC family protein [Actinomycetota bacterium]